MIDSREESVRKDEVSKSTASHTSSPSKPGPPSNTKYIILLLCYLLFSLGAGYMAGVQPTGAGWRSFSWHPFLMSCAFVGFFGSAAVTKQRGGYTNTKVG